MAIELNGPSWVKDLPIEEKIRFKHNNTERDWIVEAALPDEFGFGVGSQIGTPFDMDANEMLKKGMAVTGVNQKLGLMAKKFYEGPEETEISVDLGFEAYYSSSREVIKPIVILMMMSTAHISDLSNTEGVIKSIADQIEQTGKGAVGAATGEESETAQQAQQKDIAEMVKFLRSPNTVDVTFGKTFKIKRAYITNVEPSFSNVLDNLGYPVSATCSVTIALESPMTKVRIADAFNVTRGSVSME